MGVNLRDKEQKRQEFKAKLCGEYELIVRNAFMNGFVEGHKFGKTMGTVLPSDLDKAVDDYLEAIRES